MKFRLTFVSILTLTMFVFTTFAQDNYLLAPNITSENAASVQLAGDLVSDVEWLEILDVAINGQERYLAIWGYDADTDVLEIWDLSQGAPVSAIRPEGIVNAMAFANSSTIAAVIENEVILYDVTSGDETGRFTFGGTVTALTFSPDDSDFVVITEDAERLLHVVDAESGEIQFSLPAPDAVVYSAATTLYTATFVDGVTRFDRVDIASTEVTEAMYEYEGEIEFLASRQFGDAHIAFSDGVTLTTFTPNNLGEDSGYTLDYEGEVDSSITAMTYSRDGLLLYVAFAQSIYILDTETGETLHIAAWDDEFEVTQHLASGNIVLAATAATRAVVFTVAE